MNENKNLLGRIVALAVIVGAVYGVHAIANGGFSCAFGSGSSCAMAIPDAAADAKAAPAENLDADSNSGADEDAKLEKKGPVASPTSTK